MPVLYKQNSNSAISRGDSLSPPGYQSRQTPDMASLDSSSLHPGLRLSGDEASHLISRQTHLSPTAPSPPLLPSSQDGVHTRYVHTWALTHTYAHLTHACKLIKKKLSHPIVQQFQMKHTPSHALFPSHSRTNTQRKRHSQAVFFIHRYNAHIQTKRACFLTFFKHPGLNLL